MCGTIIQGPGVGPGLYHEDGVVHGGFPHPRGVHTFYSLDLCEDDWPVELFGGEVTLLFDGEIREGEMYDIEGRNVFAVLVANRSDHLYESYAIDALSGEQQRYVDRAEDALRRTWKEVNEMGNRWDHSL